MSKSGGKRNGLGQYSPPEGALFVDEEKVEGDEARKTGRAKEDSQGVEGEEVIKEYNNDGRRPSIGFPRKLYTAERRLKKTRQMGQ